MKFRQFRNISNLSLSFLALLLCILGCRIPEPTEKITIAVASNMQYAMDEIAEAYSIETGIPCEIIVGASGQLTAQIREGAPFDVLVSADMKFPREIEKLGLAASSPKVYAYGKIVLWTLFDDINPTMEGLKDERIEHIAIANPKLAPYGIAAKQALHFHGIHDEVEEKLVYGESITQTNQFILSRSAQVGITAKSIVTSPKMRDKGKYKDIDPRTYDPIEQGVVIIKNTDTDYSREILFCKFLSSDTAKKILRRFGYSVNE